MIVEEGGGISGAACDIWVRLRGLGGRCREAASVRCLLTSFAVEEDGFQRNEGALATLAYARAGGLRAMTALVLGPGGAETGCSWRSYRLPHTHGVGWAPSPYVF